MNYLTMNLLTLIYFIFKILSFIECINNNANYYTFAILSDVHMGADGLNSTIRLQSAIHKINELSKNLTTYLKFVFITGDITNTALKSQYDQVFSLLNTLSIDYYPIIGNHDQWSLIRFTLLYSHL
ncbi:unnamed protein product [Didymodactylos carnosus]|uniref:Calcineurin-like phosphoesterase domain-containing protein n=1 Tax=Didymodactylos carnosus TaxID=1234261 RepID=A0A816FJK0_9BILA|nr:unnamed protein product [Didymodactylos carnosus]CAF4612754.1 unnamed protein product [Didymodactylos carnosus]